jgi:hypothetical protein
VLAQGPIGEEAMLVADLEFAELHRSRSQSPRLRPGYDRHPALYSDLTRTVIPAHQAMHERDTDGPLGAIADPIAVSRHS